MTVHNGTSRQRSTNPGGSIRPKGERVLPTPDRSSPKARGERRMATRVLLVDDQEIVRAGTRQMFKGTEIQIVAETSAGAGVVDAVRKHRPDVVLLEVGPPGDRNGLAALAALQGKTPEVAVIVFSAYDHPRQIAQASALGARGFLTKSTSRKDLIAAIQRAADGEILWTGDLMRRIATAPAASPTMRVLEYPFSARELQLLRLVVSGKTNKKIADEMGIMSDTVKDHLRRMLRKTGFTSRTQLAVWAVTHGID